jgi:hypothetical protein
MKTLTQANKIITQSGKILSLGASLKTIRGLKALYDISEEPVQSDATAKVGISDLLGNGYDLSQATSGNRGNYRTSIFNGLPSVRFDGTNDRYVMALKDLTNNKAGFSFMCVYKKVSGTGNQSIFSITESGSTSSRWAFFNNIVTAVTARMLLTKPDAGTAYTTEFVQNDTNTHIAIGVVDNTGGRIQLFIDNLALPTVAITTGNSPSTNSQAIVIGAGGSETTNFFNGDLGCLGFADVAWSKDEVKAIYTVLAEKFLA